MGFFFVLFFGGLAWCEVEFVCPLGEGKFCLPWQVIIGLLLSEVSKDYSETLLGSFTVHIVY